MSPPSAARATDLGLRCVVLRFSFFSCYGDHRELHSFPTRRSSDLSSVGCRQSTVDCRLWFLRCAPEVHRRQDRKSTRLNSSHSSISYAVFCLKKKRPYTGQRSTTALGCAITRRVRWCLRTIPLSPA